MNDVGRSAKSSVVEIPAQKDILPSIPTLVHFDKKKGTYVMTWKGPTNVSGITNYTIFTVDMFDGGSARYVQDYVHVPGDQNLFEVKGNDWVG